MPISENTEKNESEVGDNTPGYLLSIASDQKISLSSLVPKQFRLDSLPSLAEIFGWPISCASTETSQQSYPTDFSSIYKSGLLQSFPEELAKKYIQDANDIHLDIKEIAKAFSTFAPADKVLLAYYSAIKLKFKISELSQIRAWAAYHRHKLANDKKFVKKALHDPYIVMSVYEVYLGKTQIENVMLRLKMICGNPFALECQEGEFSDRTDLSDRFSLNYLRIMYPEAQAVKISESAINLQRFCNDGGNYLLKKYHPKEVDNLFETVSNLSIAPEEVPQLEQFVHLRVGELIQSKAFAELVEDQPLIFVDDFLLDEIVSYKGIMSLMTDLHNLQKLRPVSAKVLKSPNPLSDSMDRFLEVKFSLKEIRLFNDLELMSIGDPQLTYRYRVETHDILNLAALALAKYYKKKLVVDLIDVVNVLKIPPAKISTLSDYVASCWNRYLTDPDYAWEFQRNPMMIFETSCFEDLYGAEIPPLLKEAVDAFLPFERKCDFISIIIAMVGVIGYYVTGDKYFILAVLVAAFNSWMMRKS